MKTLINVFRIELLKQLTKVQKNKAKINFLDDMINCHSKFEQDYVNGLEIILNFENVSGCRRCDIHAMITRQLGESILIVRNAEHTWGESLEIFNKSGMTIDEDFLVEVLTDTKGNLNWDRINLKEYLWKTTTTI